MKKTTFIKSGIVALAFAVGGLFTGTSAFAQESATAVVTETVVEAVEVDAAPAEPTLEQRVADIEAYFNNVDRPSGDASKIKVPGPGHNAWQMTSTALVLFMTLPGLALFYGGLVRSKNVLSVLAMTLGIAGLVTILWWAVGYSLTFSGGNAFIGDLAQRFFTGMSPGAVGAGYYWISDYMWAMFQLSFAIITPALIFGATAERMKFSAVLLFTAIWMFVVYFPLAHMVWGATGLMNGVWNADAKIPAIDFAGGTVVHMSSGWSALILCLLLGKRVGHGKEPMPPHSLVLTMIGTGLLWVGWYGFNAGSALAADSIAANAFLTTTIATAIAAFVWPLLEFILKGKPSVLGMCSGAVAGLVVITPACGFVDSTGAAIIGVVAGVVPYFAVTVLKGIFKYDDALDTFGIHGVGGTVGALITGVLVNPDVNGNLVSDAYAAKNGLKAAIESHSLLVAQAKAAGITIALAVIGTIVITFIVKLVIGLRPSVEAEHQGLDITDHGEEGYNH